MTMLDGMRGGGADAQLAGLARQRGNDGHGQAVQSQAQSAAMAVQRARQAEHGANETMETMARSSAAQPGSFEDLTTQLKRLDGIYKEIDQGRAESQAAAIFQQHPELAAQLPALLGKAEADVNDLRGQGYKALKIARTALTNLEDANGAAATLIKDKGGQPQALAAQSKAFNEAASQRLSQIKNMNPQDLAAMAPEQRDGLAKERAWLEGVVEHAADPSKGIDPATSNCPAPLPEALGKSHRLLKAVAEPASPIQRSVLAGARERLTSYLTGDLKATRMLAEAGQGILSDPLTGFQGQTRGPRAPEMPIAN